MQVRVVSELLSPGVQDRGESSLAAEVARIAAQAVQGLGHGGEEQGVDPRGLSQGERPQGWRQGEHQVEIRDRQQLRGLPIDPLGCLGALTGGTVAIATVLRLEREILKKAGRAAEQSELERLVPRGDRLCTLLTRPRGTKDDRTVRGAMQP